MTHVVILRSALSYVNNLTYNSQELGLAKALSTRGYKVSLIFAGKEELVVEEEEYTAYYLQIRKLHQAIGYFVNLKRLLCSLKPDIVQLHDMTMMETYRALRITKKQDVPCVLVQGPYEESRSAAKRLLEVLFNKTFGKYILDNVDAVGCKTGYAAAFLKKYKRDLKTVITPIGCDVSVFNGFCDRNKVRKEFGFDATTKVLLYVGTIDTKRRKVDLLIDMMKKMPSGYQLLIAGDGPFKSKLEKQSGNNVTWLGKLQQKELHRIFVAADLFLLPSAYEIYGMVMMEAMYHGVPVLSTKTAGACSVIRDTVDGFLINSLSSKEWGDKVQKIFASGNLAKVGENATRSIKENFLWDTTCESFIRLYNMAVSKHGSVKVES